jgi:hypothetical protein
MKWATTCTIGSSKYKNLKLRKRRKEESRFVVYGQSYIAPYRSRGLLTDRNRISLAGPGTRTNQVRAVTKVFTL